MKRSVITLWYYYKIEVFKNEEEDHDGTIIPGMK